MSVTQPGWTERQAHSARVGGVSRSRGARVSPLGDLAGLANLFDDHELAHIANDPAEAVTDHFVARLAKEIAGIVARSFVLFDGEADDRETTGSAAFADKRQRLRGRFQSQHSLLDALVRVSEPRLVLCDPASDFLIDDTRLRTRIALLGKPLWLPRMLFHHLELVMLLDNRLHVFRHVPGLDEEAARVPAYPSVQPGGDREDQKAVVCAALADDWEHWELRARRVDSVDLLVCCSERRLVLSDPLDPRMALPSLLQHASRYAHSQRRRNRLFRRERWSPGVLARTIGGVATV